MLDVLRALFVLMKCQISYFFCRHTPHLHLISYITTTYVTTTYISIICFTITNITTTHTRQNFLSHGKHIMSNVGFKDTSIIDSESDLNVYKNLGDGVVGCCSVPSSLKTPDMVSVWDSTQDLNVYLIVITAVVCCCCCCCCCYCCCCCCCCCCCYCFC